MAKPRTRHQVIFGEFILRFISHNIPFACRVDERRASKLHCKIILSILSRVLGTSRDTI